MDSLDLAAAAKSFSVYPEGAATVHGRREGSHRQREGIQKGRSPYFQHDFQTKPRRLSTYAVDIRSTTTGSITTRLTIISKQSTF